MPTTNVGPFMVTAKDINHGRILYSQARFTSWDAFNNLLTDKSRPEIGDVLVTKDGTLGRIAVVDRPDVCINQSVALLRPSARLRSRFLKYLLEEPKNFARMLGDADGSTIKHIYITRLAKMEVSVPDTETQDAILRVLASIDDKIELNRCMNETLEGMAQAIFLDWFVDFGPVRRAKAGVTNPVAIMGGCIPDPVRAAQLAALFPAAFGNNGLPTGWAIRSLGDYCQIQNGYAFKSKDWQSAGVPVVKIGSVKPSFVDLMQVSFVAQPVATEQKKFQLSPGDILVGLTGYVGETGRIPPTDTPPLLNQRVGRFNKFADGSSFSAFVYTAVRRNAFKEYAVSSAHGSAQPNVSTKQLLAFEVVAPGKRLISEFEKIAQPIYAKALHAVGENAVLSDTRDFLLPRLMSGAVRVPAAEQLAL